MKQQLHRSITFWSGLLVMAFIAWAWRDSLLSSSRIDVRSSRFVNRAGGIFVETGHPDRPFSSDRIGISEGDRCEERLPAPHCIEAEPFDPFAKVEEVDGRPVMQGLQEIMADYERYDSLPTEVQYPKTALNISKLSTFHRPTGWNLFLPHWLILLTVAAVWLGLLFWRSRRRKRVVSP